MSRAQYKGNTNICADCSASDPTWASVNRGVLLCDECCSIHRSLGRHVSQVKSLRKGSWSPTQLAMVQQLVSLGGNNVWEHSLLEPGSSKLNRRKPNPRDPVHPTKEDFIRAKYQLLAFVIKHKDSEANSIDELSKQLHACVRTANLETTLRMLSLGADPNYFHPEKGNSPLHVAAQSGQAAQVELLVIYGADPGAYDSNGKTPVDHARTENHVHLSDRLTECQYELTDKLAFYLCNRKPDHRQGQHFLIPEVADSSLDMSELAKAAKKKLQALSNHLFEELAMDVYDEVDRRENNQIWLQAQSDSTVAETHLVPFLPVNPEFSSTRNQGRQKLARFNNREFATLIIDILSDARRRQLGIISPLSTSSTPSKDKVPRLDGDQSMLKSADTSASDDDPIYDHVASDEDYASIGDNGSIKGDKSPTKEKSLETLSESTGLGQSMASSDQSDGPVTLEEYLEVKRALEESKTRIQLLVQTNRDLKQEITLLRNMVQRLMNERCPEGSEIQNVTNGYEAISEAQYTRPQPRPQSMFEPRDHKHHAHWRVIQEDSGAASSSAGDKDVKSVSTSQLQSGRMEVYSGGSDYENSVPSLPPRDPILKKDRKSAESARSSGRSDSSHHASTSDSVPSVHSVHSAHSGEAPGGAQGVQGATHMPSQDEVVRKTERITKKIQELLVSAQEGKSRSYSSCADKIHAAVHDMLFLFPQNIKDENVSLALQSLNSGCVQLQEQCITLGSEVGRDVDKRLCTQKVIQCAYNIAKAAKQLVILFE